MKIRITFHDDFTPPMLIFPRAFDACVFLLDKYRDKAEDTMGRPTLERLAIYARQFGLGVERIDHGVTVWKGVGQ